MAEFLQALLTRMDRLAPDQALVVGALLGALPMLALGALDHPAASVLAFGVVPVGLALALTGRPGWVVTGREERAKEVKAPDPEEASPAEEMNRHAPRRPPVQDLWPMVELPAGEFWMGSPEGQGDPDERPRHRVRLSAFAIGKYTITNADWARVTGEERGDPRLPVVRVNWFQALEFCNRASVKAGLRPYYVEGKLDPEADGYRLPTEAEWEYACRAGTETEYFWGEADPKDYAWFAANSEEERHPVGEKLPNFWGLHDMAGNIWEWCQDGWDDNAYRGWSGIDNPVVMVDQAPWRVMRGGSYNVTVLNLRSARRDGGEASFPSYYLGLRCVRALRPGPV